MINANVKNNKIVFFFHTKAAAHIFCSYIILSVCPKNEKTAKLKLDQISIYNWFF